MAQIAELEIEYEEAKGKATDVKNVANCITGMLDVSVYGEGCS